MSFNLSYGTPSYDRPRRPIITRTGPATKYDFYIAIVIVSIFVLFFLFIAISGFINKQGGRYTHINGIRTRKVLRNGRWVKENF